MKKTIRLTLLFYLLIFNVGQLSSAIMDTTRVNWDGISNRLCLENLVWCGLSEVTALDSSAFDTFVNRRNASFFDWRGYGEDSSDEFALVLCVVQLPDTANLVSEASSYKNSSLTDDAGPLLIETQPQWPDDIEYTIADGERLWYIQDIEDYSSSINWLPIVDVMEQKGRFDVVIGLIDTGVSLYEDWEDSEDLSHGDLMNHVFLDTARFYLGDDFDINQESNGLFDGHGHGTAMAPRDNPEDNLYSFTFIDGTSPAAAVVAGVASLVISEALDNDYELPTYKIRRIIEKTSRDVNFGEEYQNSDLSLFDFQMGYGIVDCEAAAANLDLQNWELEPEEWYWISSRINPVYKDPRRVFEDLTFQDNTFDNRLEWIASNEEDFDYYNPEEDLWGEEPWGEEPEWEWDFRNGYIIGLNEEAAENEELLICGMAQDIDVEIPVEEGWNFVAYFPYWEDEAEDVLTSIATWGDPNSGLILAKGQNGDFYSPEYSFSNLTMKPGEGYKMEMDKNATLIYPTAQPSSVNNGEHRKPTHPVHFRFISRTGYFLPILINGINVENRDAESDDEIGVFINDTMCVGAGVFEDRFPIGFAAWCDNPRTDRIEGFRNFQNLSFRYWDNSENEEIGQNEISVSFIDTIHEPSLLVLTLDFTGSIKESGTADQFGLISVYPNPFNSQTVIHYSLTDPSSICINVLDINGRLIKTVINRFSNRGQYRIDFNAASLAAGSYIVELNTSEKRFTKLVELVK